MENTIENLFITKNRVIEVPNYQRAFSWEKEHIDQFIDDLQESPNPYYLGHFLFERKTGGDNSNIYVIDGQQRLTVCIILFSVIYNELAKRKASGENVTVNIDDIKDYYLRDIRKGIQKFITVPDDNNFFAKEIIDSEKAHTQEPNTASKKKLIEAKRLISKYISGLSTKDIESVYKLVENASITEHIVSNKITAIQIFSFQNDRGKKLSNLEIIKANLMFTIYQNCNSPDKTVESIRFIESDFSRIYNQIVKVSLHEDEVLNYYWRSVSVKGFYSDMVVRGLKESISMEPDKVKYILDFVSGLAQAFQYIEEIEKSNDSCIKDLLYLNNMALSYPFLLRAHSLRCDNKTIHRLAHFLENITFRSLIRGGRAEIQSRLNPFLLGLKSVKDADTSIESMISSINNNAWWYYWSDKAIMEIFISGSFYGNPVDNYVLWKYELYLCSPNHPLPHSLTYSDFILKESIEHIAPQTPTNGDPVANGYGEYENKETPENGIESGRWLNCLGNLALISQPHNSSIGNKPFNEKLASYGKDNLLNQQKEIASFVRETGGIWNRNAIERRLKQIVEAAKQIWDVASI